MRPTFEIVTTTAGAVSIRNNVVNEIMHNPVGPWAEANALYIEQSRLSERLQQDTARELVIFDVGLGAAANALAVLHCLQRTAKIAQTRPVRLISFERDLELLKFALLHADQFAHFKGFETAIQTLLDTGCWQAPGVDWQLRHGDFLELIQHETEPAHLVFFDPYSPTVNFEMWTIEAFQKLYQRCDPTHGGILFTYSRATPIRVALFAAGFYVGAGLPTGLKDETTQASTHPHLLDRILGVPWLERWQRSQKPHALGSDPEQYDAIRKKVLAHPQFAARPG